MANPDRPRGFTPVRHVNGGSWNNALAERYTPDFADLDAATQDWAFGIGSPMTMTDEDAAATSGPLANLGVCKPMVDEDNSGALVGTVGVVVGIGHVGGGDTLNQESGPWDADDLTRVGLTASEVEADTDGWVLYIAPAKGWIFEAQTALALATVNVGDLLDINVADDEAVQVGATGKSNVELTTASNNNVRVVGIKESPDNDMELANADLYVMFHDPAWAVAESQ